MSTTIPPPPFLERLRRAEPVVRLLAARPSPGAPQRLRGLAGSLPGLLAALYFREHATQVVLVCADGASARDAWNDAGLVLSDKELLFLAPRSAATNRQVASFDDHMAEQADVLRAVRENPVRLIVTDAESALSEAPSARALNEHSLTVEMYASLRQEELTRRLAFGGFERNDFVGATGDYAVRGGIVDVFPVGFDNPLRIEFLGDMVESIREFDPLNQRSIRSLETVGFVTSLFLADEAADRPATLFDHAANDAVFFIDNPDLLAREAETRGRGEDLRMALALFAAFEIPALAGSAEALDIGAETQPAFNGSITLLREYLDECALLPRDVYLVADSEQQALRLDDLLHAPLRGPGAYGDDDDEPPPAAPRTALFCPVSRGFVLPAAGFVVLTEHQVFNRQRIQKSAKKGARGLSLRELRQLKPGDYVVHVDKGIGKFVGLQTITVNGGVQETAKVLYAGDDVLYVNLAYIARLQRYSSEEGATPALSKLGSGEWDRLKERTRKRLKDIARDLIALYAKRKAVRGHAFSPDGGWQKEMEASFIYEDTPDQERATIDVKRDMESAVPMDRLVCGDVGYGKTEVAIRAAFKAALDGKQTAVLVPTTILAQQHFNTFHDRLHRYSVVVESLSRFKTKAEQAAVIDRLKRGGVDIVIGTHRMLSADVAFKDLGLLIIDEEHRFGVAAKEKLRRLREHVDTLALTATPIPRTLNFSLLGARDLSIIETPPKNRLPVLTSILPFEKDTVLEGITREMKRGGQVYFVNDRIGDLETLAGKIRAIVPGVRIAIAHGQMTGAELERVMTRFLEKRVDVLVTTKIIESGLDIPNANTIFVHRAERFGLAELYQLRGRVGRSNIQAYAYFLVPPEARMTRDAVKRLQALEEFSDLGSGFHLAMRDLEIRGAGNLLGAEQSGFIADIGFELYLRTIEEAVSELKQEEFTEVFADRPEEPERPRDDVTMELGLDAYLPQTYVGNSTERFDLYKRLYNSDSDEAIDTIADEIADRFGRPPEETINLLSVVRQRLVAARIRLARVTYQATRLVLAFPPEDDTVFYEKHFQALVDWIMAHKHRMKLEQDARELRLVISGVETRADVAALLAEMLDLCLAAAEKIRAAAADAKNGTEGVA
ncbi:MAG: transcription-repair coupling factor [Ignavibacteriae bacterium]|nr:transcription-repair coupling factor [Ignavibacteriota bacterium]